VPGGRLEIRHQVASDRIVEYPTASAVGRHVDVRARATRCGRLGDRTHARQRLRAGVRPHTEQGLITVSIEAAWCRENAITMCGGTPAQDGQDTRLFVLAVLATEPDHPVRAIVVAPLERPYFGRPPPVFEQLDPAAVQKRQKGHGQIRFRALRRLVRDAVPPERGTATRLYLHPSDQCHCHSRFK
jgi:hypothetical protein